LYKIINGGHTWPGGNPAYLIIPGYNMGNTNFDINASEIMWDFFKNYELSEPTSVNDDIKIPSTFTLFQNYPNPFNPCTKISWQSPASNRQTIKVYDVLGNEVAVLVNEIKPAGYYEVEFDGSKLTSGVYFYQLKVGNFVEMKKMILLR
jgi:hypothetical protein